VEVAVIWIGMKPTRRPMKPDEYAALRIRAGYLDTPGSQPYRGQTSYVPMAICVGFALWLIPIFAINAVLPPRDLVLNFGCGSLFVLLAGSLWFFRRGARRKNLVLEAEHERHVADLQKRYATDLQAHEVDEWRLRVVDAVKAEEYLDVSDDFYLELEDGRVLLVSENDLRDEQYDQDHEIRFPTREVILAWLPHADEMMGIDGVGDQLPVSGSWPSFRSEAYEHGRVPDHGKFLPGPISRYRNAHYDDDEDGAGEDAR
jgi:hypothetical protein